MALPKQSLLLFVPNAKTTFVLMYVPSVQFEGWEVARDLSNIGLRREEEVLLKAWRNQEENLPWKTTKKKKG